MENIRTNLSKEQLEQKIEALGLALQTAIHKPTIECLEGQIHDHTIQYMTLTNNLNNQYLPNKNKGG